MEQHPAPRPNGSSAFFNPMHPPLISIGAAAGLLALGAAAWAGCSSSRPGTAAGGSVAEGPRFERHVAPFDVRDQDGTPYDHPFLGGLNVPRPQFADVDADGDLDLLVQEVTGSIMFFEQVGTPEAPNYVWRTDKFLGIDVGEWFRFTDFDNDGDADILAEQKFSYIQYLRNDGTPGRPRFVQAADTLRDVEGKPLFSDRQNIPNVTDIDCDGKLDLFIGRLDGTVMRYEAASNDAQGLPKFTLVTDRFENIEIIGQLQMGIRHGANSLTFADLDRDGDQDLFWGDFFEPGLLYIENTGSCARPSLRGEPVPFPTDDPIETSGYNAPAFADLDADDDLDLFVGVLGGAFNPVMTAADNLYFLRQTEPGSFEVTTERFLNGIDVGSESIPAFADFDGDGDQDLMIGNKIDPGNFQSGYVFLFENQGTPEQPSFQRTDTLHLNEAYHHAPAPADLDGDGDLDLLVGTWKGDMALYRNQGTAQEPRFELEDAAYVELTRGSNSTPALVDIDGDGDLDLFAGESSGTINFYRNVGSATAPAFELESDNYEEIDVGRRSYPAFVDLDGDGDQDMVVGTDGSGLHYFRNDGSPEAPAFVEDATFSLTVPDISAPAFVDIDGDGDADFFSGGIGGGLVYYENLLRSK